MKNLLILVVLAFTTELLKAQPVLQWQRCLGGSGYDFANCIRQTSDGGFIMAGYTTSNNGDVIGNHGAEDFWIVKLDANGNFQWQQCMGGADNEQANAIEQTSDGGFIIAGYTFSINGDVSGNQGNKDAWIVKLSSSGNLQWQKCIGGTEADQANSVIQTPDSGYVFAGYTYSNNGNVAGNHGENDFLVCKLDANGNLVWQKCFGGTESEYANSIQETSTGGFFIAGYTYSINGDVSGNHGSYDSWVIELTDTGIIVSQKCLGGTAIDVANEVQPVNSGGLIVVGNTASNNGDVSGNHGTNGTFDQWIVRLNSSNGIVWQKCLGGTDEDVAFSVQQTVDGGFIVGGNAWSTNGNVMNSHGFSDFWVVKMDISGNILWQKCLGGSNFEMARSIRQTTDGGYIVAGFTLSDNGDVSGNHGFYDAWIVKLSALTIPLPIELISFNGAIQKCSSLLNWSTASEINNNYFTVLRSDDAVHYEIIGSIDGAGNSNNPRHYAFIDEDPHPGSNYYKLSQTDYDGATTEFKPITVSHSLMNVVYSNSETDVFELQLNCTMENLTGMEIYNLTGQCVYRRRLTDLTPFTVSGLADGVYLIRVLSPASAYQSPLFVF
jgi:hypothetical protein